MGKGQILEIKTGFMLDKCYIEHCVICVWVLKAFQCMLQVFFKHVSPLAMVMQTCNILLHMFVLFDLILNITLTIFQLYRDGSSLVEPVLSKD